MKKCGLASRDGEQSMANRIHDVGIAGQIGTYSDAVEAPANARWLVTAGTPGLDAYGKVPSDFGAQAELAWTHIVAMLKRADMTVHDPREGDAISAASLRYRGLCRGARSPSRRRAAGLAAADRAEFGAARVPVGDRGLRWESVTRRRCRLISHLPRSTNRRHATTAGASHRSASWLPCSAGDLAFTAMASTWRSCSVSSVGRHR